MKRVLLVLCGLLLTGCGGDPTRELSRQPGPCAAGGATTGDVAATVLPGDVPMVRGDAAGTGRLAGPGPAGAPVLRWCFDTGQAVNGAPVVADGVVYVASNSWPNPVGVLYAIDAGSGRERWRAQFAGAEWPSPPAVDRGVVYVCAYVPPPGLGEAAQGNAPPEHGVLYALDAATGRERWRFPVPDAGGDVYDCSPPVVDAGVVYFAKNGRVYALDAATGGLRWVAPTQSLYYQQPAVADGTVYLGGSAELVALSAVDGTRRWGVEFHVTEYGRIGSPVAANGIVYATVDVEDRSPSWTGSPSRQTGALYALDAATGAERWHAASHPFIGSRPAVADGVVYVERDVDLDALDAATGARRWRHDAQGVGDPVVADGVVYFRYGSTLHAIDAGTGQERWRMVVGSANGAPIVAGGTVYVAGDGHYLYAIGGTEPAGTG